MRAGFAVFAIDYRKAPKHPFPAQLEDCLTAIDWLYTHRETLLIDCELLSTWGYSAGGHLATLTALKSTEPIRCVVAGGAPWSFDLILDDDPDLREVCSVDLIFYLHSPYLHSVSWWDPSRGTWGISAGLHKFQHSGGLPAKRVIFLIPWDQRRNQPCNAFRTFCTKAAERRGGIGCASEPNGRDRALRGCH